MFGSAVSLVVALVFSVATTVSCGVEYVRCGVLSHVSVMYCPVSYRIEMACAVDARLDFVGMCYEHALCVYMRIFLFVSGFVIQITH